MSKVSKKKKKYEAPVSPKAIDASLKLVEKAAEAFTNVTRLTALDRRRAAKLKRGAHQVIPTIAHLARKFAVEAPGLSIDEMVSEIEMAQGLEPLLGAIGDLHATLRDEYLRSQSASWKTATVTYAMLRKASEANQSVATELEPVQKWFRHRARGASNAATPTTVVPPTPADAKPASTSNGAANVVTDGAAPHAG
jgi:hypothetical protein